MISQLNLTLWAWIESVRGLRRAGAWIPFLLMIGLQTLGLFAITEFHRPILAWLVAPLLVAATSPPVLHYPQFFLALPTLFSRVNMALDLVAGSLIFGAAAWILWDLALGGNGRGAWSKARRRWGALLLLRLPIAVLPFLFYYLVPRFYGSSGLDTPTAIRTVRYGGFLIGVVLESLFVYGPLAILVQGRSATQAIGETVRFAIRVPLATFLIVLVPNLVHLPLAAALRRAESMILKLTPETVGWMVFVSILVYVAAAYLSLASAVRVFGARAEVTEGGRP